MADLEEDGKVPSKVWMYIGVSVAGLMVLIVAAFLVYLCIRKCRRRGLASSEEDSGSRTEPTDAMMQGIMQNNKVGSVSRYGKKGRKGETLVAGSVKKPDQDYFLNLASKMKVKSISDYKK